MSNIFETQYIRSMKHRNFLFIRFANRDITYFIYRNTFDIMAYAICTAYILLKKARKNEL